MAFFQLLIRFLICPLNFVSVRKKYRSLGCYRESPRRRLLPVLEKNFRSSMKWTAIDEVVEDCYEIVKKTHYKVFGFKFYGECWVGERPEPQYKTSMDRCFLHVVGKAHSYYVYEVVQVYEICLPPFKLYLDGRYSVIDPYKACLGQFQSAIFLFFSFSFCKQKTTGAKNNKAFSLYHNMIEPSPAFVVVFYYKYVLEQ